MSLIVLGTVATDTVKTPFGLRKNILGGSAAHFSMSARLFTPVNIVAAVGEDFPAKYINLLKQRGVILDALTREKGKSFSWTGEYEGDLNTAITRKTELGVLLTFDPKITAQQKNIKYVFLANIDPHIQRKLLDQIRAPRLVAMDTMNFWIDTQRRALLKMLKRVDIFVANDQEARSLSGENNLLKAAKRLRALGPEMILIKKGEHGVLFYSRKFIFALPAYPCEKVIDPTGAGDTFAGGFMGYLARTGKVDAASIKNALAYGTIAASFNIEDFGLDRTAGLSLGDLTARLKQFKKIVL
ncbi:MAG: PfkB family carbohydrate kinase [Candidatus Omnitrophica bacterium]|nr:PfkB family carbohydrate kinase [Candidatus Omnitrophota bacterium]